MIVDYLGRPLRRAKQFGFAAGLQGPVYEIAPKDHRAAEVEAIGFPAPEADHEDIEEIWHLQLRL